MTFPVDEKVFIEQWLSAIDNADEADVEFVTVMVQTINWAYEAGLKDGKREATL